jgi:hypothetical protein
VGSWRARALLLGAADESDLAEDFTLHAMPDACVNLLFNQHDTRIAGVTQLHTTHTTLDLGRSFHYAGIQFFPGVWRGDPMHRSTTTSVSPTRATCHLVEVGEAAADVDFDGKQQCSPSSSRPSSTLVSSHRIR